MSDHPYSNGGEKIIRPDTPGPNMGEQATKLAGYTGGYKTWKDAMRQFGKARATLSIVFYEDGSYNFDADKALTPLDLACVATLIAPHIQAGTARLMATMEQMALAQKAAFLKGRAGQA